MRKLILIILAVALVAIGVLYLIPENPDDVVESFYEELISYQGNPIEDRIYESSKYVTEDFIENTNALIESEFEEGGYPVLCRDDLPESFSTVITETGSNTASVRVILFFEEGNEDANVGLERVGANWKINQISCIGEVNTSESSFEEEGHLNLEDEKWVLVYERPGEPALTAELELSDDAKCIDDGIRTLCFESSFEEGLRVKVSGEENEGVIQVKEIEFIRSNSFSGTIISVDEEVSLLVVMTQDGIEAVSVEVTDETEIIETLDSETNELSLEDLNSGDKVTIEGWPGGGVFEAVSIEVTARGESSGSQIIGSSGIEE